MVKAMIRLVLVNVLKFVFAFTVGQLKGSGHNLHKKFAKFFFKIVADSKYNFSLSKRLYSKKYIYIFILVSKTLFKQRFPHN